MYCRKLIYFLLIAIFVIGFHSVASPDEKGVVALVDGVRITEGEVAVDKEKVDQNVRQKKNGKPNIAELTTAINEAEKQKLVRIIRSTIRERAFKELGITANDKEVKEAIEKAEPILKEKPQEALEIERSYFSKLSAALKEALKHPEKEKDIYESRLKSLMSYRTWKGSQMQFNTMEKISKIEKAIPQSVSELYQSRELSMKELILNEKLEKTILKDVKTSDPMERNRRIHEWWQDRYKKAKIEIKDDRFKDINGMIIEDGNKKK